MRKPPEALAVFGVINPGAARLFIMTTVLIVLAVILAVNILIGLAMLYVHWKERNHNDLD